MKSIIYNIIIILLLPCYINAQGVEKKYVRAKVDTLKMLDDKPKTFKLFRGEILTRGKGGLSMLPNGSKLNLGYSNKDMESYSGPKILPEIILPKLIVKHKVFLNDGKLHEGYLFNLNHKELIIEEEKEIIIANYSGKVFSLKKNGDGAISSYPYDPSGLVFFFKSLQKFSDPYIRIIIPGYVTAFIDKKTIKEESIAYDHKIFEEYVITVDEFSKFVLLNNKTQELCTLDKSTFQNVSKLSDGIYPIVSSKEGVKLQFNIIGGVANKETVKQEAESFLDLLTPWHITAIVGFSVLLALLIWFGRPLLDKLLGKRKSKNDKSDSDSSWADGAESENETDFNTVKETTGRINEIPSKSLKKITERITKKVEESQRKIESEIKSLRREINSKGNSETESLRGEQQQLESKNQRLLTEKEGLSQQVLDLTKANEKKQASLNLLIPKIERFEKQGFFIENYHAQIDKLATFFNDIKNIENQIIEAISSETNHTVKKFQSIVLTKYLKNNKESKFNEWDSILTTVKNNDGLIVDKNLIHKIENKASDDDKLKGIEWLIVNDVIILKINALLIILEELSNTSKITESGSDFSTNTVVKHKADLISKMKQLFGIQIDNVTLFSNFQMYSNIKSMQGKVSYDLNSVVLQMGDIKEIITYGMKLKEKAIETLVIEK